MKQMRASKKELIPVFLFVCSVSLLIALLLLLPPLLPQLLGTEQPVQRFRGSFYGQHVHHGHRVESCRPHGGDAVEHPKRTQPL